jgi:hypothetical protein
MDHLVDEFLRSLSVVDAAGLVAVLGLAIYGVTGIGEDDGVGGDADGD